MDPGRCWNTAGAWHQEKKAPNAHPSYRAYALFHDLG